MSDPYTPPPLPTQPPPLPTQPPPIPPPAPEKRMFCANCGQALQRDAAACSCGAPVPSTKPAFDSKAVGDHVKLASKNAFGAFRTFIVSPVGGIGVAYDGLGKTAAQNVGIVFGVVSAVALAIGAKSMFRASLMSSMIFGVLLFVGLTGAAFVARIAFKGAKGSIGGDLFLSGAALLPMAALVLASSILGAGNAEVISLLGVAALVYSVLLVYAGATRISGIPDGLAAPAVAAIFVLGAWLTKVLLFSANR